MQLETPRLLLYPLTGAQLRQAGRDIRAVARSFGAVIAPFGFWEMAAKRRIYAAKRELLELYPSAWLLSTSWFIVEKATGRVVGEAGFKGPPDAGDAVEIGYGVRESERCKGFMSEAAEALVSFAFAQTALYVGAVSALTLPENLASHRVLIKNGFVRRSRPGKYWYWEKERAQEEGERA